ncbi:hypothetical protein GV054_12125 [Marinomonas mediterranea]|nr:hypothetical protein GV054_12125 [Marinomonas mediterranea]
MTNPFCRSPVLDRARLRTYFCLLFMIMATALMSACDKKGKPLVAANMLQGGSLDGRYSFGEVYLHSGGGKTYVGVGGVGGYPGPTIAGGGIGVPSYIEGDWAKKYEDKTPGYHSYYRISAPIDATLAEKKIRTMLGYYKHYKPKYGTMQVAVKKEEIRVLFTLDCYEKWDDCTPNEGADPNGYVINAPQGSSDVVELFRGKGESSRLPFAASSFDPRNFRIHEHKSKHGKVALTNGLGVATRQQEEVTHLSHIKATWQQFDSEFELDPNDDMNIIFTPPYDPNAPYFEVDAELDTALIEEKIQAYQTVHKRALGYTVIQVILNGDGWLRLYYNSHCQTELDRKLSDCFYVPIDDPNGWFTTVPLVGDKNQMARLRKAPFYYTTKDFDQHRKFGVLLFEAKGKVIPKPEDKSEGER